MPSYQPPDANAWARFLGYLGTDVRSPFQPAETKAALPEVSSLLPDTAFAPPSSGVSLSAGTAAPTPDFGSILSGIIGSMGGGSQSAAPAPAAPAPPRSVGGTGGGGGHPSGINWTDQYGRPVDGLTGRPVGGGPAHPNTTLSFDFGGGVPRL